MTAGSFYQANPIRRMRSTKAEVEHRRAGLYEIIKAMRPMTVRQVFYQATVRDLVEKTEAGYNKVQTDLVLMRRSGDLPYDWLADNTRWQRRPRTFSSVEQALQDTARLYRKSLWDGANAYVEIWLEKDALSGVVLPVTSMFDVPLMVARGIRLSVVLAQRGGVHQRHRDTDLHLPPRRPRSERRQRRVEDRADPPGDGAGVRHSLRATGCHAGADDRMEPSLAAHQGQ